MTVAPYLCVRCQQGGGVVACPWCRAQGKTAFYHHSAEQWRDRHGEHGLRCLVEHVQEAHGKGGKV